jgi:hypothetical protein
LGIVDTRLLKRAAGAWLTLIAFGTLGYHTLGGPEWTWLDALYMTIITIEAGIGNELFLFFLLGLVEHLLKFV